MNRMQIGKSAGIARIIGRDKFSHVGMGILIAPRVVLTCWHVVEVASWIEIDENHDACHNVNLDFPFSTGRDTIKGKVVKNIKTLDVAVVKLDQDAPPEAGVAILADISDSMDQDDLSIFGSPSGIDEGKHVSARFVAPTNESLIQIDAADRGRSGLFLKPGYSGAGVWNEEHQAVIGMTTAVDSETHVQIAYMTRVSAIASCLQLPHEDRSIPRRLEVAWTITGILCLTVLGYLFHTQTAATDGQNPRLRVFLGMHLWPIFAILMGVLWRAHAKNFELHTWPWRVPLMRRLHLVYAPTAHKLIAVAALLGAVAFPAYAQGRFITGFHTRGHVYVYMKDFGYERDQFGLGCVKPGLCRHPSAGRYSLVKPRDGAIGGYWNNRYHYGDSVAEANLKSVTFFPILQPLVVFVFTSIGLWINFSALLATFRPVKPTVLIKV